MTTRRHFLTLSGLFVAGAALAQPDDLCAVATKEAQAATTADQALQRLKAGNERFRTGRSLHCDLMAQIKASAQGQAPFAAVLGCMDSRVAPELVFDQQLGDILTVRVAGNIVNTDNLGSLEYATKVLGTKLIVVLGHSECGAVKGAIDDVKLGNVTALLANIRPAVLKVAVGEGDHTSKNKKFVQSVADQNARDAAALLTAHSELLAAQVAEHQVKIVSAMHDISTGAIRWLG
ncbi:MAG TPA: carbonic anhydrase [Steroidobacteraceae bacterium]|jgi:carbonic anhydrase|nr:carbonic anhydrase [Steroidobacteraceae bacterium]